MLSVCIDKPGGMHYCKLNLPSTEQNQILITRWHINRYKWKPRRMSEQANWRSPLCWLLFSGLLSAQLARHWNARVPAGSARGEWRQSALKRAMTVTAVSLFIKANKGFNYSLYNWHCHLLLIPGQSALNENFALLRGSTRNTFKEQHSGRLVVQRLAWAPLGHTDSLQGEEMLFLLFSFTLSLPELCYNSAH